MDYMLDYDSGDADGSNSHSPVGWKRETVVQEALASMRRKLLDIELTVTDTPAATVCKMRALSASLCIEIEELDGFWKEG
jgi:hypothetical protein